MKINLNGINDTIATFYATENVKKGDLVVLSDGFTVDVAADSGIFIGTCLDVRNGMATVNLFGYAEFPYTGSAPSLGANALAANGKGGVKQASYSSGRIVLVVDVDTTASVVKFLLA